jgi:arylsulfatase A-like enzyme
MMPNTNRCGHFPGCLALLLIALIGTTQTVRAQTTRPTTRPIPQVDRLLIVSIDGLRPDLVFRCRMPNLQRLVQGGSFSFWAQTIPTANTLPSHTSMLTGVSMRKHGIDFNDERATTRPIYPRALTLFEVAKKAGYTTAMVTGKSKFMSLNKPGTIDWVWVPSGNKTTDAETADAAGAVMRLYKPQVMFLHFPGGDTTGHAHGWASKEQFAAFEGIDESLGMIFNALETSGLANSTVIIVSADHGGSGKSHGANDPRSLHIPWIAYGPGVRKNYDLTTLRNLTVKTEDTFATACFLLGLELPDGLDGRPLHHIVEGYELMREVQQPATAPAASPATLPTTPMPAGAT